MWRLGKMGDPGNKIKLEDTQNKTKGVKRPETRKAMVLRELGSGLTTYVTRFILAEKEVIEADYAREKLPKPTLPTVYKPNPTPKEISIPNPDKSKNIIANIHFTNLKR
ncbi:hypothetical protein PCANC_16036 [Puccinia coronata f. sp. avenae]|uniref:Uncharacterized protein n=1 Tax=Puccinia coronata f. sp. avenae TaxID=200324 RepID=A0A2N5ULN6_9BASI|nr:hypothetical protein PCANC_16036 [Puccinia coronata f. sp. avenae]